MKILFSKVNRSPMSFSHETQGCKLEGDLKKVSFSEVELKSKMSGEIELTCDRCGASFISPLNTVMDLTLTDRVAKVEELDTVEFLDGIIDIDFLIESEINALKSNYNYCPKCSSDDSELDIEY